MYKFLLRPILFLFNPEGIHHFTFGMLRIFSPIVKLVRSAFVLEHPSLEREVLGLKFKNPVGLAAGFDKNALLIDELACFGFGFIEIGTLTPKAQPGNPKPRLFRLPKDHGLINRMGFNNDGVDAAVQRLKKKKSDVLVGGNIGKNKITPNEQAFEDYKICFEALYPHVDYFVVNVSSPNTPGLRDLQEKEPLKKLLLEVRALNLAKQKPRPVFLKIAPDLTQGQLDDVIQILKETDTKGVIATNTTISREDLISNKSELDVIGAGGLSGKPLRERATEVIKYLREGLGKEFAIIGVGGIMDSADAIEKIKAGADLVQVYTGFIYEGPALAKRINREVVRHFS
ncbi:MAG: quinone-dependent dihydroorotate dehydrogenase [Cyclobacteriaceae bacterium]|nr:quinone-dependent dihydroorotate dehydrogenase [Cyclobacteriaceae bacterium]